MKKNINLNKEDLSNLKKLFDETRIGFGVFIFPSLLALTAALFDGLSLGLLAPLMKGIIESDFTSFTQKPIIKEWFTRFGIINLQSAHPNQQAFMLLLGIIVVSILLKNVFQYFSFFIFDVQILRFSNRLRQMLFRRCLSFGKIFFDRTGIGNLSQIILGFTRQIMTTARTTHQALSGMLALLIYIVIMFFISWKLTLMSIILFPFVNYSVSELTKRIRKNSISMFQSQNELSRKAANIIMGIPLVKAYSREKEEGDHFADLSSKVTTIEVSIAKKQRLVPVIHQITGLGSLLLLLAVAVYLSAKSNQQNVGYFLVFFLVLRRAMGNAGSFSLLKAQLAEVGSPISEIQKILSEYKEFIISDGERDFLGLKNEICFKDLSFFYGEDRIILKNINLIIPKGKTTAIVGKTGSGKTTLIHLLLRFYDIGAGMILLDGEDIRNFKVKSLHSCMALVSQDPVLFNDTIKQNILYGIERTVSDQEFKEVLRKARLEELINGLPKNVDTVIGDRGVQLSGGERQRVALARAILRNAEILILDEATSAMDSKTEKWIQEAISEVIRGKTAIIIAHRLSTIREADKVIVLEDGMLIEQGSPADLLSKKTKFYNYWQEQQSNFQEKIL